MQVDMFTAKSLEIFESYDGTKKGSLIDTIDETKTASGARMLRDLLKAPLIKKKENKKIKNLIKYLIKKNKI